MIADPKDLLRGVLILYDMGIDPKKPLTPQQLSEYNRRMAETEEEHAAD